MTLRDSDRQSESDLDSMCDSCIVYNFDFHFHFFPALCTIHLFSSVLLSHHILTPFSFYITLNTSFLFFFTYIYYITNNLHYRCFLVPLNQVLISHCSLFQTASPQTYFQAVNILFIETALSSLLS